MEFEIVDKKIKIDEKSKLINQTKKEVKKLRLELNNIERSKNEK